MKKRIILILLLSSLCLLAFGCDHAPADIGSIKNASAEIGTDAAESKAAQQNMTDSSASSQEESATLPSIKDMPPPEAFKGVISMSNSTINVLKSDGSLWSALIDYDVQRKTIALGRDLNIFGVFEKIMDHVTYTYARNVGHVCNETCFAITEDGTLWGWGRLTDSGPTGIEIQNQILPKKILEFVVQVCEQVSADGSSYYALKEDGSLWAWGVFDGYYFTPTLAATGVTKLLNNEESTDPSVWFIKEDGNAYCLIVDFSHTTANFIEETSYYLEEKLMMKNVADFWGRVVITGDGEVWDLGDATYHNRSEQGWNIADDKAVMIVEDAVQISDAWLRKYIAVSRNGHLVAWDHFYLNYCYGNLPDPYHRNFIPSLITENCRYFVCYGYDAYRYIDMDGNLRSVTEEGADTLIDENVCYGYENYYIKNDGNLYMTKWKGDHSYDIVKVLDDVMIP